MVCRRVDEEIDFHKIRFQREKTLRGIKDSTEGRHLEIREDT